MLSAGVVRKSAGRAVALGCVCETIVLEFLPCVQIECGKGERSRLPSYTYICFLILMPWDSRWG